MTTSIRVLVVDDSALVRQLLTRALSGDPQIEVVGTACNGIEALEKAGDLSPDVITLDIEMPELDGIQVLRLLRRRSDARVVVLSSIADAATTYLALSLGAIDFVQKPTGIATSIAELSVEMRAKIRTAFHVDPARVAAIVRGSIADLSGHPPPQAVQPSPEIARRAPAVCVGLAASTGGPPALETVFSGLSGDLSAAFVVVQHLPAGFHASFARRLLGRTGMPFVQAEADMALEAGCGYVAPHGRHLTVTAGQDGTRRFSLREDPPLHGVRPAADPMLMSLAEQFGPRSIAVVLTGMGCDGAVGCSAVARVGGEVIVQDEETSVVWGMPRAALHAGATTDTYPLSAIAERIGWAVRDRAGR